MRFRATRSRTTDSSRSSRPSWLFTSNRLARQHHAELDASIAEADAFEVSDLKTRPPQIEAAQAWWVDNRLSARVLFLDELSSVERLLREDPLFGAGYESHKSGAIRRVLLSGTPKHLTTAIGRTEMS
jgi:hypothetical protein